MNNWIGFLTNFSLITKYCDNKKHVVLCDPMPSWTLDRSGNAVQNEIKNTQIFFHAMSDRSTGDWRCGKVYSEYSLCMLVFNGVSNFINKKLNSYKLNYKWLIFSKNSFILCGVSPAVVVPMMIDLQEKKIGIAKRIPTLVIAASCFDNIIAITGYSLMINMAFSQGNQLLFKVLFIYIY